MPNTTIHIAMIAAVGRKSAIGVENSLPWHIPEDFKFFKEKTLGKPVIMGRKTYESIGKPLPKRLNIIVTRNKDSVAEADNLIVATSLEQAIKIAKEWAEANGVHEIMIGGGQQIYKQALPYVDTIYLTEIDIDVPDADAFFPSLGADIWHKVHERDAHNHQFHWKWTIYKKI